MIKIHKLTGFKCLGSWNSFTTSRYAVGCNLTVVPRTDNDTGNLRINGTYMHITITDVSDIEMLEFLGIHVQAIRNVVTLIEQSLDEAPTIKSFHIVIKQDDRYDEGYVKLYYEKPIADIKFIEYFKTIDTVNYCTVEK